MGNIFTSSIGRKLVMSISGAFLFFFLAFHMAMNATLLFSDEAYDTVVAFLGANWYALVGTIVLMGGVFVHFLFATVVTIQNRRARGRMRYAVSRRPKGVEWASNNMYILGAVVLGGLFLHLFNFWYNMQWTEIIGQHVNSMGHSPLEGAWLVRNLFSQPIYVAVYLVWLAAVWLHLTHGVWSMMQSVGFNSKVWMKRMKFLSYALATLIMGGFALVIVVLYIQSLL